MILRFVTFSFIICLLVIIFIIVLYRIVVCGWVSHFL
jgi:hypothetical protein